MLPVAGYFCHCVFCVLLCCLFFLGGDEPPLVVPSGWPAPEGLLRRRGDNYLSRWLNLPV